MEREYRIGEVAKLLGVTQDALRFYEEKGILSPCKSDNGYRYYMADDIWTLIDVIFYRKINYSLENIEAIVQHHNYDDIMELTKLKIDEEKRYLKTHKQYLLKIENTYEYYQMVARYLNTYQVCAFPEFYVMSEKRKDGDQTRDDWFQLVKRQPEFEMCYNYEEFHIAESIVQPAFTYLAMGGEMMRKLGLRRKIKEAQRFPYQQCIFTVVDSNGRSPSPEHLECLINWAKEQDLNLEGTIHTQYIMACRSKERVVNYLAVYAPIISTGCPEE